MENTRPSYTKRPKRAATLCMRMQVATRDRLEALAVKAGISASKMAEDLMTAGMFWVAFQRTVMEDADTLPSNDEIKAAFRTIEALKARAA